MSKKVNRVKTIAQDAFIKKNKLENERRQLNKQIIAVERSIEQMIQDHIKMLSESDINKYILHTVGEFNKKEITISLKEIGQTIQKEFYFKNDEAIKKTLVNLEQKKLLSLTPHGYLLTNPVKLKTAIESPCLGILKKMEREKAKLLSEKENTHKQIQGLENILDTLHFTVNIRQPTGQQILQFLKEHKDQSFSIQDLQKVFPTKKVEVITASISKMRNSSKPIIVDEEISKPTKYYYKYAE